MNIKYFIVFGTITVMFFTSKALLSANQLTIDSAPSFEKMNILKSCKELAQAYKNKLPSKRLDLACDISRIHEVKKDIVPIIITSAFFDLDKQKRKLALSLMKNYECKTTTECESLLKLIDKSTYILKKMNANSNDLLNAKLLSQKFTKLKKLLN